MVFEPGDGLGCTFAERISGNLAQVGGGMKGIDNMNGIGEQAFRQVPNPNGAVAKNNQLLG